MQVYEKKEAIFKPIIIELETREEAELLYKLSCKIHVNKMKELGISHDDAEKIFNGFFTDIYKPLKSALGE